MLCKLIVKHYIPAVIIGALLIFSRDLIKFIVKNTGNIDKIDIFVDIIIFVIFFIVITILKKNCKG